MHKRWMIVALMVCAIAAGGRVVADEPKPAPAKTDEQAQKEVTKIVQDVMANDAGGGPYAAKMALRVKLRAYIDANKGNVGGAWGLVQLAGTCDYEPKEQVPLFEEFLKLYPKHTMTQGVKQQMEVLKKGFVPPELPK